MKINFNSETIFKISQIFIAILFTIIFAIVVIPPLIENPDILGAFGAGFVNLYLSDYERKQFVMERKTFKPFEKKFMTHPDGYGWKYLYSQGNLEYYLVSMGPIAVAEILEDMVVYFEIIEGKEAREIYRKYSNGIFFT